MLHALFHFTCYASDERDTSHLDHTWITLGSHPRSRTMSIVEKAASDNESLALVLQFLHDSDNKQNKSLKEQQNALNKVIETLAVNETCLKELQKALIEAHNAQKQQENALNKVFEAVNKQRQELEVVRANNKTINANLKVVLGSNSETKKQITQYLHNLQKWCKSLFLKVYEKLTEINAHLNVHNQKFGNLDNQFTEMCSLQGKNFNLDQETTSIIPSPESIVYRMETNQLEKDLEHYLTQSTQPSGYF